MSCSPLVHSCSFSCETFQVYLLIIFTDITAEDLELPMWKLF